MDALHWQSGNTRSVYRIGPSMEPYWLLSHTTWWTQYVKIPTTLAVRAPCQLTRVRIAEACRATKRAYLTNHDVDQSVDSEHNPRDPISVARDGLEARSFPTFIHRGDLMDRTQQRYGIHGIPINLMKFTKKGSVTFQVGREPTPHGHGPVPLAGLR